MQPIVHVVDDDPSFLNAATRLLRAGGYSVQKFTSARDFLQHLTADTTGCIVLDLRMPGQNGLELQTALTESENPIPIIFLTGHGDIPATVRAMRRGAVDFLTKPVNKRNLFDAVNRALVRDTAERERRARRREINARFETLTARECEVLTHIIRGQLNKQIAFDLGIRERTIKAHRGSIMVKLHVQSVAELVRLAEELGLQPAP